MTLRLDENPNNTIDEVCWFTDYVSVMWRFGHRKDENQQFERLVLMVTSVDVIHGLCLTGWTHHA
jgi:hypothetical protein